MLDVDRVGRHDDGERKPTVQRGRTDWRLNDVRCGHMCLAHMRPQRFPDPCAFCRPVLLYLPPQTILGSTGRNGYDPRIRGTVSYIPMRLAKRIPVAEPTSSRDASVIVFG